MKKGNISKAVAALRTTPLAEATPTTLAALQAKHPDAVLPTSTYVTGYTLSALRVTPNDLGEILKQCPNGVGAGPSGTCFEHLKDPALASEEVLILLAKTVSHLLSTFQTQAVREVLLPLRLIALEKPGGGVRPIAIGEAILCIVAKAALKELSQNMREFFLPVKFGVSVTGGAEYIIHALFLLLKEDETRVALQLDIKNAFNRVERPAFFQALSQSKLASLLPLVRKLYEGPSWLLVDHRLGVDQIMSSRGVCQVDPLGPLLFAAAIQPTLLSTATLLPEVAIVACADHITIVGPRDATYEAFINITTELTSLELRCNIAKSTGWGQSTEEGSDIPPPRVLPINTTEIGVLGIPIGTPAFCTNQAQTRLI
ncbi:unnamed protein product [Closterium sp. NIES-53]